MTKTNIYAPLIGLAGAGKDTFLSMIDEYADPGTVTCDKFAGPLKDAALKVFGVTFDDRNVKEYAQEVCTVRHKNAMLELGNRLGVEMPEYSLHLRALFGSCNVSPRKWQQIVGTEVVRNLNQSAWINRFRLENIMNSERITISTDCRFPNERGIFEYDHGWEERPILILKAKNLEELGPKPEHSSEHMAWELSHKFLTEGPDSMPEFMVVKNWKCLGWLEMLAESAYYTLMENE